MHNSRTITGTIDKNAEKRIGAVSWNSLVTRMEVAGASRKPMPK